MKEQLEEFPETSVAVTFTRVTPSSNYVLGSLSYEILMGFTVSLSVAEAEKFTMRSYYYISRGHLSVGATVSGIVTSNVHENLTLPLSLVTCTITVVLPKGNKVFDAGVAVYVYPCP